MHSFHRRLAFKLFMLMVALHALARAHSEDESLLGATAHSTDTWAFADLLGNYSEKEFVRTYWQKRPLHTGLLEDQGSERTQHSPARLRKIRRLLSMAALEAVTQSPSFKDKLTDFFKPPDPTKNAREALFMRVLAGLGRVAVLFVQPPTHFIPDPLTYSVPLCLRATSVGAAGPHVGARPEPREADQALEGRLR